MLPSFACANTANGLARYAILLCNLRSGTTITTDGNHAAFRQLGVDVFLASGCTTVGNGIVAILLSRCPTKMVWSKATQMPIPARMGSISLRERGRSVSYLAHNVLRGSVNTLGNYLAVPISIARERPNQTVMSLVGCICINPTNRRSALSDERRSVTSRTMRLPPPVMHLAHAARLMSLGASGNRTYPHATTPFGIGRIISE